MAALVSGWQAGSSARGGDEVAAGQRSRRRRASGAGTDRGFFVEIGRDSYRAARRGSDQPRRHGRSGGGPRGAHESSSVISLPAGTRIWIAAGVGLPDLLHQMDC